MHPHHRESRGGGLIPRVSVRPGLSILCATIGLALAAGASHAQPSGRPFAAPTFTMSSIVSWDRSDPRAPCDRPECVQRRLGASSMVRLTGEFGSFTGKVAHWSTESLSGFDTDPNWGGTPPTSPVQWAQVERVEARATRAGLGAVLGAVAGGTLAYFLTKERQKDTPPWLSVFDVAPSYSNPKSDVGAVFVGTVIGGSVGAITGSAFSRWMPVYRRPAASEGAAR